MLSQFRDLDLPIDLLVIVGLATALVILLINLAILMTGFRRLRKQVERQEDVIGRLYDDAVNRAPAETAVAALIMSARDREQSLDAIEAQLAELLNDWDHVEDIARQTHELLQTLRQRGETTASESSMEPSAPDRHRW